ncbi:MAG: DUF1292 domain-containing protein [Eubacterium sp.]|nr:DUF1292 domain-containing protein [Eubacterium sp.]
MLTADDGSEEAFFVVEKADIAGGSYLLVADSLEEDADAMILKETEEDGAVVYETVEDEDELRIISKYFEELLEEEVELRFE